jgi:hypothetical protein
MNALLTLGIFEESPCYKEAFILDEAPPANIIKFGELSDFFTQSQLEFMFIDLVTFKFNLISVLKK